MNNQQPTTVQAWRFHRARNGAYRHMVLEDDVMPSFDPENAPPNTSLIRTLAVSLNPIDIKFSQIPVVGPFIQPMPSIPGSDASGVVMATNDPSLSKGQLVMCRLKEHRSDGVLATYFLVCGKDQCIPVPDGVSPMQAATVGTCGVTAFQAMEQNLRNDGQQKRIFINGGSGGTGVFEIQIAKAAGHHVTTSCSGKNMQFCLDLGADEVINYETTNIPSELALASKTQSRLFDLILDNTSGNWDLYRLACDYLHEQGVFVQIGNEINMEFSKYISLVKSYQMLPYGKSRKWVFYRMDMCQYAAEDVLN